MKTNYLWAKTNTISDQDIDQRLHILHAMMLWVSSFVATLWKPTILTQIPISSSIRDALYQLVYILVDFHVEQNFSTRELMTTISLQWLKNWTKRGLGYHIGKKNDWDDNIISTFLSFTIRYRLIMTILLMPGNRRELNLCILSFPGGLER